ncbi:MULTISPECIES: YtxH domain-containing protein [Rhodopseudomonas]|uniref:Nutrient deprivation-induced protein n=1 Tax=Rhodopseudomonas palustris TaxID=1076 RepID=A0A0D7E2C1_RHOPL|nr:MULTISPECIES: YtxH domain-containing protein [Rhodopseudomonas]KIZ34625.1 hypothetical protein OO17_26565 [Rhodopseudomonas palustris]MDF3812875.1 YtxH domain-containing protein [Rhodopseudomonas sp. BAL398]WOK17513.1 YtxH domain-containing protein [Rhodopseudomonas sp. BAL398]
MAEHDTTSNLSSDAGAKSASGGGRTKRQQVNEMADQAVEAGRDLKDEIKDRVADFKDQIGDAAQASSEKVKSQAADFVETAKEFASQAGETIKDKANAQKNVGADYVGHLAEAMRRAAREFEGDLPIAAVYMRKAASRVEEVSDAVHQGEVQDLVKGMQSFARRQPTAFLGLAVLAGFGAVRFLKSSGGYAADDQDTTSRRDMASNSD